MRKTFDQVDTRTAILRIKDGALGPLPACELQLRPLTVFVGPQGSGKSLAAQVLYFFEELPYLVQWLLTTERGSASWEAEHIVGFLLDQLRSAGRRFATFANKKVRIDWSRGEPWEIQSLENKAALGFRMYRVNRLVKLSSKDRREVEHLRDYAGQRRHVRHHALFFPTERIVTPLLRTIGALRVVRLPITYDLFDHWLVEHGVESESEDNDPFETELLNILGGQVLRRGDDWKWKFKEGQFDLDLASSGQRANWSLPYLTRALRIQAGRSSVAPGLVLFVEEPEIHLHPEAQVGVVRLLARMVNLGFRVVVTTHSLDVLYAVNNLVQAGSLTEHNGPNLPATDVRLKREQVSVYRFRQGLSPESLVDEETGFISESELGRVSQSLAEEYNRIS